MTYRVPEPPRWANELKTPMLVKRWWMRPLCLLVGHHWHWVRWNPVQQKDRTHKRINKKITDLGADKFCRRCGAESYDCDDSYEYKSRFGESTSCIVETIKP